MPRTRKSTTRSHSARGTARSRSASSSRRGSSRTAGRERDEEGRFASDDHMGYEGNGYGMRSSRSQGRGHGGWFGDSEGHAQAREGQGARSIGRSRSDEDYDDEDYGVSSRVGRGGRSMGGRGHGGWFGDAEGHAQAAREGWSERSGSRSCAYDDEDDDDSRSSRSGRGGRSMSGRGHGGWFGDSEGHSEAARRR